MKIIPQLESNPTLSFFFHPVPINSRGLQRSGSFQFCSSASLIYPKEVAENVENVNEEGSENSC